MNYRSVADLAALIWDMPIPDVDAVAGVPRSGMLAASMIALRHHLHLTDVGALQAGGEVLSGPRLRKDGEIESVLVVDDSVLSGGTMQRVRARLADVPYDLTYCGIYVDRRHTRTVDLYGEILPRPRVFEWNILHHGILARGCVDIDGVLCVDPTPEQDDDGQRYRRFLRTARPLYVPRVRIGHLVTCRLEKYRDLTVDWLRRQGVEYRELHMLDLPDKNARLRRHAHVAFKAAIYQQTRSRIFLESSRRQAVGIAKATGRPVFCLEDRRMY